MQQFSTILVGDARLKAIARNETEERAIEALRLKKEISQHKRAEYRAGVEQQQAGRIERQHENEAMKAARLAELARLVVKGGKSFESAKEHPKLTLKHLETSPKRSRVAVYLWTLYISLILYAVRLQRISIIFVKRFHLLKNFRLCCA